MGVSLRIVQLNISSWISDLGVLGHLQGEAL